MANSLLERKSGGSPPGTPAAQPSERSRTRVSSRSLLIAGAVLILLYLVMGPLLVLVGGSLQTSPVGIPFVSGSSWSFQNYATAFGSADTYRSLGVTMVFSLGSLTLAFVIAATFAWLIERTDIPLPNLWFVLLVAPTGIPHVISAIGWALLLNPSNGMLNLMLEPLGFTINIYSLAGMIFVQALGMVPVTFLLIVAAFRAMNAVLEDAAGMSGARMPAVLRKITLPLLAPALLGALIYQFVTAVETVDVPLILGLPAGITVLSTGIYVGTHPVVGLPDYGLASAYGILLLALALGPILVYNKVIGARGNYATVTGRAYRAKTIELGRWRLPVVFGMVLFVVVSFLLPFLVLLWTSLQPYYAGLSMEALDRVSFQGYVAAWESETVRLALKNTIVVGVCSAVFAMTLSVLVSWVIVRSRSRFVSLLDFLAFMPHAMPGVVIGLSILLLYLLLPVGVYGTVWIIVIAMATQFVSLGTRLCSSAFAQTQVTLEEAAATSGAPIRQVWLRVLIPLIRPTVLNGCLLIFMASMKNLTLPLMLSSSDNPVLSTLIWSRWEYGLVTETAVVSVLMTALTVLVASLMRGGSGQRKVPQLQDDGFIDKAADPVRPS